MRVIRVMVFIVLVYCEFLTVFFKERIHVFHKVRISFMQFTDMIPNRDPITVVERKLPFRRLPKNPVTFTKRGTAPSV